MAQLRRLGVAPHSRRSSQNGVPSEKWEGWLASEIGITPTSGVVSGILAAVRCDLLTLIRAATGDRLDFRLGFLLRQKYATLHGDHASGGHGLPALKTTL